MICQWCSEKTAIIKITRVHFVFDTIALPIGKQFSICQDCIPNIVKAWLDSSHKINIRYLK